LGEPAAEEDMSNSLFTFNFLNDDFGSSQRPKEVEVKPEPEASSSIQEKPEEEKQEDNLNIQDFSSIMGLMKDENSLNSNFHNFFTNDRIFGSPSPPVGGGFMDGQPSNPNNGS